MILQYSLHKNISQELYKYIFRTTSAIQTPKSFINYGLQFLCYLSQLFINRNMLFKHQNSNDIFNNVYFYLYLYLSYTFYTYIF
jgi:succinate-acetate transporter protein